MTRYNIKVIPTAGYNMYIFRDMRIYRKLFNANSKWLIKLPKMNAAGF